MLIIIDKRMPEKAKQTLSGYGELLEFVSSGITYKEISGHPDIFFCQTPAGLVAAPNVPFVFEEELAQHGIRCIHGNLPVGKTYPETARYNAVVTSRFLVHNSALTDSVIPDLNPGSEAICVSQGYSRCNLMEIREEQFITSDKGIENTLVSRGINVNFFSPDGIVLPGYEHGFLGGCCGIHGDKFFVTGSLRFLKEGGELRALLNRAGLEIIELYDGPLFDGGSILFIEQSS
jgi:hypothetical protein